ncbi:uncharacterized protein FFNC_15399 [Fusarium fujikuroi]|nr:uncharacterized protein FFNC_15399 [Fusarium fujikuroi]
MSANPVNRTIVGKDCTSQEAQAYVSIPVTFPVTTDIVKWYIVNQDSFKDLEEIVPLSIRRSHFEMNDLHSMVVVKFALFGCEAFHLAATTCQLWNLATREGDEPRKLIQHIERGGVDNAEITELKKNVDWMMELVTLWIALARRQGIIQIGKSMIRVV